MEKYRRTCSCSKSLRKTNSIWKQNKTPFYPNHCSDFTISIYPNDDNTIKLKYGCPSREEINIPYDEEFANKCYTCNYFPYCKGDCECFNNICTFPKKWFNYIKENCID